jgi:hypothetical protein
MNALLITTANEEGGSTIESTASTAQKVIEDGNEDLALGRTLVHVHIASTIALTTLSDIARKRMTTTTQSALNGELNPLVHALHLLAHPVGLGDHLPRPLTHLPLKTANRRADAALQSEKEPHNLTSPNNSVHGRTRKGRGNLLLQHYQRRKILKGCDPARSVRHSMNPQPLEY